MRKIFTLFFVVLSFLAVKSQAQTYAWNRTDSADFQVATNWTPTRTTPAATDVLVFNNGAAGTVVSNIPNTQTIAGFQVTANTFVRITNTHTALVTITGGTGPQFTIDAGSTLEVAGAVTADSVGFNLSTGTTASISGNFTMKSYGGTPAHRFRVKDASGATFNNGSVFTFGPAVAGNSFGSAVNASSGNNSVVFANGSRYIFRAGANPFAQAAPNSFVVFQTGSTYDHQSTGAPAISGRTYANFDYNNTGAAISSVGGGTFTVDNLNVNSSTFNINLTGAININGNVSVATGATLGFIPATSDSIFFAGPAPQTLGGGTGGTLTFGPLSRVIINGSQGVTLGRSLTMNTLAMQFGILTLGNFNLTATTVRTGVLASWIQTNGTGTLTINGVGATPVLFPVGFSTYNPLTISNTGTADNFSVSVQNTLDNATFDNTHAVKRQWNISEAVAGGSNCALTFQWSSSDEGASMTHSVNYVGHWNGASYDLFSTTVGGADPAWTASVSGVTTFSPFVVTDDIGLPVELSSFTWEVTGNNVKLNWSTVSELNNSGFDVERKSVTGEWTKVSNVNGNGTSNSVHSYNYEDRNITTGKYNYRLKQVDFNGNYKYYQLTNEVEVGTPSNFKLSQNYPNPFNPSTTINYELPKSNFVSLKIYDMMGREVASLVNQAQDAGFYSIKFDASKLSSGIYFYKIQAGDFSAVKKLMLVK